MDWEETAESAELLGAYRQTTFIMLLQWAILTPQGPKADLAAVIFAKPVQVSSIRIFPTGAKPFAKCSEIVAYVPVSRQASTN